MRNYLIQSTTAYRPTPAMRDFFDGLSSREKAALAVKAGYSRNTFYIRMREGRFLKRTAVAFAHEIGRPLDELFEPCPE